MSGGVGAKGQGAVLGDAVQNMASLSLDEDSSNCWSQLRTDVPRYHDEIDKNDAATEQALRRNR